MIAKRVQKAVERQVKYAEGGDTSMHKRQTAGPVQPGRTGKAIRPNKASRRNYAKGGRVK